MRLFNVLVPSPIRFNAIATVMWVLVVSGAIGFAVEYPSTNGHSEMLASQDGNVPVESWRDPFDDQCLYVDMGHDRDDELWKTIGEPFVIELDSVVAKETAEREIILPPSGDKISGVLLRRQDSQVLYYIDDRKLQANGYSLRVVKASGPNGHTLIYRRQADDECGEREIKGPPAARYEVRLNTQETINSRNIMYSTQGKLIIE